MQFRPCIDLHQGKVKQIVGATLGTDGAPIVNFEAEHSSAYYASLYRSDNLKGGHVIQLGSGNEAAARAALEAYPQGLQVGGGVCLANAESWIEAGAAAVIITSAVFHSGAVDWNCLRALVDAVGKDRLVLDLSCRWRDGHYVIVADRWQTFTDVVVDAEGVAALAEYCSEFLVHAVDVEGKQSGVDERLLEILANLDNCPITYAGGVRDMADLHKIRLVGQDKIHVTVGSALDIFGGKLAYREVVDYCSNRLQPDKKGLKKRGAD